MTYDLMVLFFVIAHLPHYEQRGVLSFGEHKDLVIVGYNRC